MIVGIYNGNGNWKKPSDIPNNLIFKFRRASWNLVERKKKSEIFKNFNELYPNTELLDLTNFKLDYKGLEIKIEKYRKIIIVTNDSLAHGQLNLIKFLLKKKKIYLLNSNNRNLKLGHTLFIELFIKQYLERFMILEFLIIIPIIFISLFLSLIDLIKFFFQKR